MRAYTVATAAVALGVATKWVDNVLSHHAIPGVVQSRQGVARRLTGEAVSVLEIALRLTRGFGIPIRHALQLAITDGSPAETRREMDGCEIRIEVASIRSEVEIRLAEAVEFTPLPRRGRPRKL